MKPVQQHILEWVEHMRARNFSPESIRTYKQRLKRFTLFLAEQDIEDLGLVDRAQVQRFWQDLLKLGFSVHSLGCECRAIKSLFAFLNASEVLAHDPSAFLVDPSKRERLPKAAPPYAEVKRLLEQPDVKTVQGLRDKAALELVYSTGIRAGEFNALLLSDLDLDDGVIRVRHGKGGKGRVVPLGIHACRYVRLYLEQSRPFYRTVCGEDSHYLFLGRFGRHMHDSDLRMVMRKYRQEADLSALLTPHGLRRAAATGMIARAGKEAADIGAVQQLLGHSRIDVTSRYAQVLGEDLKDLHRQVHPRAKTQERLDLSPDFVGATYKRD